MEDNFHDSEHIPQEKLMLLIKRNDSPALFRFAVMTIFVTSSAFLVLSFNMNFYLIILSHLIFGLAILTTFACEHETVHGTAFKSKFLNSFASRFCAVFQIYPSAMFRELHFTHHRYTHIPGKDPEISFGGKPIPSVVSSLPMYFSWVSGLPLFMMKFIMLFSGLSGMSSFIIKNFFQDIQAGI